jgi:Holliday junction resolvase
VSHPSKRKGDGFELEVVHFLQAAGIAAEKIPLSGAIKGGSFEGDIAVPIRGVRRAA